MFLYIILIIIAVLVILVMAAPREYEVSRKIVINRSLSETFQYLKLVKNQDHWSPWKKKDPNMTSTHSGVDGTVGFVNSWKGNKEVGEGEQEIKKVVENERVDSELRFFKPWKSVSDAYLITNEIAPSQTEVIWGFKGKNPRPFNVFMLFFSMDKTVGKDFKEGLESLKFELEKQ